MYIWSLVSQRLFCKIVIMCPNLRDFLNLLSSYFSPYYYSWLRSHISDLPPFYLFEHATITFLSWYIPSTHLHTLLSKLDAGIEYSFLQHPAILAPSAFHSFIHFVVGKKVQIYIRSCITHHPPESPFIHPPELLIKPAEWCPFVVALCFVGVWSFLHCIGPLAYLSSLMVAWCSLYSFLPPRFPFLFFSFFLSYLPALPKYSTKSHRICLGCDLLFFLFSFLFSILVLRTMLNECIRFDEKIIKSIW